MESGQRELRVRPVAALEGLRPYATEAVLQPVDLRLDGNEGIEPPESVFDAARAAGVGSVRTYPSAAELERVLAERVGCDPSMVLVTAGADDGLDRACRAVLGPGRELVTATPTFEMIPRSARLVGAGVVEVPWWDGEYPLAAIMGAVSERTGAIAVVSPNNPTGLIAGEADVRALAERFPACLIMLDGAYEEFAERPLSMLALEYPNVVAFRTMSKAWGLAGIRVGYCFGDARVMRWLRTTGGPYAVSGPSIAMALERLGADQARTEAYVANVRRERDLLGKQLAARGVRAARSEGNFVLARFEEGSARDDRWVRDALAGVGVLVRRFGSRPELKGALRMTCPGEPGAFARLSMGLDAALGPEAILFDLDGVLADVSRSYRRAIIETCATFGVTVTAEEIARAKAEGDANNDWILSRRLLARAGVERSLEEVTARFEEIYQGTDAAPGLRATETLLCDPLVLKRLALRLPLAIVTGRPRADAMRFLAEKGILPVFRTLVCMEDAALKPAPDPALKAMRRLGVRSAWMIGDTVDDVRCARGAGVIPLGIVQPGEAADPAAREAAALTLLKAGAARVLDRVEQIEELLS
jgi:histidinol-phosphate aminotransferase